VLAVDFARLDYGAALHIEDSKVHGGLAAICLVNVVEAGFGQVLEVIVLFGLGDPAEARRLQQHGEGSLVGRHLVARALAFSVALSLKALNHFGIGALQRERISHDGVDHGS